MLPAVKPDTEHAMPRPSRLALPLALLAAALTAAPLTETATAWRFGDAASLALEIDKTSGAWTGLTVAGRNLVPEGESIPACRLNSDNRWLPDNEFPSRLESVLPVGENGMQVTLAFGDWTVAIEYTLFPETRRLRRRASLTWNGPEEIKLRGFALTAPALAVDPESGLWFNPGNWPPSRRAAAEFVPGTRRSHNRQPVPLVVQYAPGRSLLGAHDLLRPDADNGSVTVEEKTGALAVSQAFHTLARMRPGNRQSVGDAWLWFVENDADAALLRFHDLLRDLDCVVPADRPAWLESAVLHSFHPGGTIGSTFRDLGGFAPATAYLDRIADLGCNAIWIMPIEDVSVYHPRDYYKFQEGLGTGEEYRALVARAHELGMHVLQDIVPHGGRNTFPRALEHPEWLVQEEDGSTLGYWCFDFNWPEWRDYMADVARHYVREYNIDGYRVDACGGSKIANWNPAIPYERASFALLQGGMNMLRGLRGAVKEFKPERGAILAESNSDAQGAVSDAIYDFTFCYNVLHDLRKRPAAEFVRDLRLWLHEQAAAGPEGLLRLRHIESHDSLRALGWYGLEPQRALFALSAFIPGIPLVYHEGEEGSSEEFRTIIRLRRQFPELNGGSADYLSVPAPPGVFACLRQRDQHRSLVLINFNSTPAVFPDGMSDLELPPFAYRILRNGRLYPEPVARPEAPAARPNPPGLVTCGTLALELDPATGLPRAAYRNGEPVTGAWDLFLPAGTPPAEPAVFQGDRAAQRRHGDSTLRIAYEETGLRLNWDGPVPRGAALAIPLTQAKIWSAHAAEGVFADEYRVRHPAGNGFNSSIYWHPQGTSVVWDSLPHPFPADGTGALAAGNFRLGLPQPPPRARWFERIGDDQRLTAVLAWHDPESPLPESSELRLDLSASGTTKRPSVPALIPAGGGWELGNAPFRLRIAGNGALTSLGDGDGRQLVRLGDVYTDAGFAPVKERYAASNDVEAFARFEAIGDELRASFAGTLRGFYRFARQGTPVRYAIDYRFAPGNSFRMRAAVLPQGDAVGERAFLALYFPTPDIKTYRFEKDGQVIAEGDIGDGRQRSFQTSGMEKPVVPDRILIGDGTRTLYQLSDIQAGAGSIDNVFVHGTQFFLTFLDTPAPPSVARRWRWIEATVTPGETAAATLAPLPSLPAAEPAGGILRDGGFEDIADRPLSLLTAQPLPSWTVNTAWQPPQGGGQLVRQPVHSGTQAAEVVGRNGDYRLWNQALPLDAFPAGSRWRLTAWVKGETITRGTIDWQVPTVRFAVRTDTTRYVSTPLPLGTFDWQQISVEWTVPPDLAALAVQAGQNGSEGTLWIDDVRLERLD